MFTIVVVAKEYVHEHFCHVGTMWLTDERFRCTSHLPCQLEVSIVLVTELLTG